MKQICQKVLSVLMILALCSGCATTASTTTASAPATGETGETTAEGASTSTGTTASSTTSDSTKTKVQGAGIGALIGGAIGGIIGAALLGRQGAAIGVAAGMALGGVSGYGLGRAVAASKQRYANEEDKLNGMAKAAWQDNKALCEHNSQTEAQIKNLESEIATVKQNYSQNVAQRSDLEETRKKVMTVIALNEKQKSAMAGEVNTLDTYAQSLKQKGQDAKVAQLDQEVSELKKNIGVLDNNNKQLAQMADSLSAEK
jgi:outer membrane lipoprotein SlyB